MNIYIADFETRAGDKALKENKTYVWAWAMVNLYNDEDILTGNTINNFINNIRKLGNCLIYFHNLKFDGNFIIDYLLRHGFKHTRERKLNKGEFSTVINESGVWYEVKINFGYRSQITIHDSMKKLPFSVRDIGTSFNTERKKLTLDYEGEREERHILTSEEREYILNDVYVVQEALKIQYENGMEKITIGADCLNEYINMMGGKEKFRRVFPFLKKEEDDFIRKSYKGGWCYVNKKGTYKNVNGYTADVNSLYPSVMHSMSKCYYPVGDGEYFEGCYEYDELMPLFFQRLKVEFVLKDGYLPTVQVKGNMLYKGNEWLTKTEEPLELTLTKPDLELLFDHYEIISCEFIDGYKFHAGIGLFDDYINKWAEIKKTSKGAKRTLAKLFLNNLYGKFAMKTEKVDKIPYIGEDDILHFKTTEVEEKNSVYIPVGAYITAYARKFTITAAQENYDIFCYADTDSIHCIDEPKGIKIDDVAFCCWKIESRWNEAKFVRQKTYAEKVDGVWELKCAGMNDESKEEFLRLLKDGSYTIDDFDVGLCIPGKKLKPKQVKGGVILENTDFTMREGYFFKF